MTTMTEAEFLTVEAAARLAGKTPRTIYRWVREGVLGAYGTRLGGAMMIKRSELEDAIRIVPLERNKGEQE